MVDMQEIVETTTVPTEGPVFKDFFYAEYGQLARAMFALTGDGSDAEDIAQETMVRVLDSFARSMFSVA